MSSTALYKAFIEVGASEDSATRAAEDIIQVSQLPQLATKTDIASLKSDIARVEVKMAEMEARFIKWMVGSMFVFAGIIIAGVGILSSKFCCPQELFSNLLQERGQLPRLKSAAPWFWGAW